MTRNRQLTLPKIAGGILGSMLILAFVRLNELLTESP